MGVSLQHHTFYMDRAILAKAYIISMDEHGCALE